MKNIVLGAAIATALLTSQAQAAITLDASGKPVVDPATTNILYLSGASAAVTFIERLITSADVPVKDRICTGTVYKYKDAPVGSDQNAYLCVANNTGANRNTGMPTNKANLLIYKRSAGGSAFGVSPIVAEANGNNTQAAIEFMRLSAACSAPVLSGGLQTLTCPYTLTDASTFFKQVPDFGISDVDPAQFTGVNTPAGFSNVTPTDVAKLTVKAASAVAFGVPVTLDLFKTLQAVQQTTGEVPASCALGDNSEACLPNLTSAQIASIHAGAWADWNALKVLDASDNTVKGLYDWAAINTPALLPGDVALHTCRREKGSGTQAQSNIKFLAAPCTAAASATSPLADTTADFVEGDGFPIIHENNSSGRVSNCLDELQVGNNANNGFNNTWGKRWAVGIHSLERSSANFEFVKVDGVAPTLANIAKGKYKDWAENTFQYGINHFKATNPNLAGLSSTEIAALKLAADAVIKAAGAPQVMASLNNGFVHSFGNGSFLAVPNNFAPEADGAFNPARPVNPYSHATGESSVNACRVPTIFNGGPASL